VVALLARLGTSLPVEPIADRAELVQTFDLGAFGRAPARFDEAELDRLNAAIVHQMAFAEVADRLPEGMDEAAWLAIRPNLERVADAADWWRVITGPIELPAFDADTRAYLQAANDALQWGPDTWRQWTEALKSATGRKGKALFLPLRQALTGQDSGPEMVRLLPLLGEDTVRRRLERAAG
jgi:glutamyl-tRNA synthetase